MLKFSFLLFSSLLLVNQIYSQDLNFCNIKPITPAPQFPNISISSKFSQNIERNRQDRGQTEEIQEYFDGVDNYGVSVNLLGGIETRTYSFYDQNQILVIKGSQCAVYSLNDFIQLTDFYVTTVNGKPHIISGLGILLQNANIKLSYTGRDNIRGIPVLNWQACIPIEKPNKGTMKLTISYSDEIFSHWSPAIFTTGFKQFPVQSKTETQDATSGAITVEVDTITQFRPGVLLNMENFNTPSGVFCPGRISRKPMSFKVPDAFSVTAQFARSDNGANSFTGKLSVVNIDVDYIKQLARYDYYDNGQRITDIHDFDTGLSYKTNRNTGVCDVSAIANRNEAHQAYEFFQFDKQPEFQYTGTRRVRGILTDVYAAPRTFGTNQSFETIFEWYFMADGFISQENTAVEQNEPVMLKIVPKSLDNTPTYIQYSGFDRTRNNFFDFDVSACEQIKNQHLKFAIDSNDYYEMKSHQRLVRGELFFSILKYTDVSFLRVSKLETIFDNGYVFVVFTLLDKPSFFGNNNRTNKDVSLEDAITKLQNTINRGEFTFQFITSATKTISVTAEKNSLVRLEQNNGRFSFTEDTEKSGYSGGSLAGFIIGFLLIGFVVGLVGGVFLILRRNTPISLPGPLSIFNPTFNKAAGSSSA